MVAAQNKKSEMQFSLREITDQKKWQAMQDSMAEVTGMAILTVDYKGIPATKHSYCQKFCEIMRADANASKFCEKCDSRGGLEAVRLNKPYMYLCHANVVDIAIPIVIEEKYIGAVMAGQVLLPEAESKYHLEKIVHDSMMEERFKSNQQLWECYKTLPVYTMKKLEMMTRMIENISKYIVEEAIIKNTLYEVNRRILNIEESNNQLADMDRMDEIKKQVTLIERMDLINRQVEHTYSILICDAIDYIRENLEQSVTLSEIANHCHVSKSYFSRLFKKETNENFSDYVIKYKMSIALEQLVSTEKQIGEISNDLGFNDCSYFIKCFKKLKGVTPMVYRKFTKSGVSAFL